MAPAAQKLGATGSKSSTAAVQPERPRLNQGEGARLARVRTGRTCGAEVEVGVLLCRRRSCSETGKALEEVSQAWQKSKAWIRIGRIVD